MGGSAAEAPTTPDGIRASDAERDEAISELGDQYAAGRLSHETFMHRMDEAYGARSRRQLDRLLVDLPRRKAARTLASLRDGLRRHAQSGLDSLSRVSVPARTGRAVQPQPAPAPGPALPLFFPPGGRTSGQRYTIGREPQCDLLVTHTSVSRHHARLEHRGGQWLLTDLGSTNGTRLNGWRVRETVPVQAGDQVMFGSALFVVREAQHAGPGGPAGQDTPGSG